MNIIFIDKPNETVVLSIEDFDMQNLAIQDFGVAIASENTTVIMPDMSKIKGNPNFYIGVVYNKTGCKLLPPNGGIFLSKTYQQGIDFDSANTSTINLKYFTGNFYFVVGLSS